MGDGESRTCGAACSKLAAHSTDITLPGPGGISAASHLKSQLGWVLLSEPCSDLGATTYRICFLTLSLGSRIRVLG